MGTISFDTDEIQEYFRIFSGNKPTVINSAANSIKGKTYNSKPLKLKDYKDKPEQYNKITQSLKMMGIEYTDESDINDLLGKVKNFNQTTDNVAFAANLRRGR